MNNICPLDKHLLCTQLPSFMLKSHSCTTGSFFSLPSISTPYQYYQVYRCERSSCPLPRLHNHFQFLHVVSSVIIFFLIVCMFIHFLMFKNLYRLLTTYNGKRLMSLLLPPPHPNFLSWYTPSLILLQYFFF